MVLSIIAGVLYGFNMVPVQYLGKTITPQPEPIHFAFSHFTGIFLMSTLLLIVVSNNKRYWIYGRSIYLRIEVKQRLHFFGTKFYKFYFNEISTVRDRKEEQAIHGSEYYSPWSLRWNILGYCSMRILRWKHQARFDYRYVLDAIRPFKFGLQLIIIHNSLSGPGLSNDFFGLI